MADYLNRLRAKQSEQACDKKMIDSEELASIVSSAVQAAITEAISEGGTIETWADGRYKH